MNLTSRAIGGSVVYRYAPRSHTIYLNVTNRCTNDCCFCVKNYSDGLSGYQLWLAEEPSVDEIWNTFQKEVRESDGEVVWCGFGEPTMRLDVVLDITGRIKRKHPHMKIRLNTDGLSQLRERKRRVARELRGAGMDSVSISLNAESQEKYDELCRPSMAGSYGALLDFARDCKKYISEVVLTVVSVEGIDSLACEGIAKDIGCDFRIR